jgi:hypothetical protein
VRLDSSRDVPDHGKKEPREPFPSIAGENQLRFGSRSRILKLRSVATITENAATVAEQGAHVAPEKASSKKRASHKKGAPKGQKAAE